METELRNGFLRKTLARCRTGVLEVTPMTHTEATKIVDAAADVLGWSAERIADYLNVSTDAIRAWARDGGKERDVHRTSAAGLTRLQRRIEREEGK